MMEILLGSYIFVGVIVAFLLGCIVFLDADAYAMAAPSNGVTLLKFAAASLVGGVVWPIPVFIWIGAVVLFYGSGHERL